MSTGLEFSGHGLPLGYVRTLRIVRVGCGSPEGVIVASHRL